MASRRSAPPAGPNMTPVLIAIVAIVAVVGFLAVSSKGKDDTTEPEVEGIEGTPMGEGDPFAHVGDVAPPPPRTTNDAPPGLLEDATYQRALVLAQDGIALVDAAIEARNGGDEETYLEKARAGRDKLFEAKESTTDWLMDLQDKFPKDRQVKQIEQSRRSWDKALKKVKNLQ